MALWRGVIGQLRIWLINKSLLQTSTGQEIFNSVWFATRVSKYCSTKTSPFKILYGCEPKLPIEMDYKIKKGNPVAPSVQEIEEEWEEGSCEEQIEAMLSIKQVLVEAPGNIKKDLETQSKYYNRIHTTKPLKIGQKVLKRNLKDTRRKEKLVQKWSAHPYTITGINECGNVYVKDIWGKAHKHEIFCKLSSVHTFQFINFFLHCTHLKIWPYGLCLIILWVVTVNILFLPLCIFGTVTAMQIIWIIFFVVNIFCHQPI